MASSSEVNVHMEEVVVVTTPDNAGQTLSEEEKDILVATDLEQAGKNMEQSTESSTSISLPKETVLERFDVEAEILYPITCGDSKANLVWKKFVCPGINIKCVQLNEHLISPKEFVYLAGKSTLKDWKRAIRLNGTMLRKIMDSGELDFYQHSRLCSNTCRSAKIDLVGSRASLSSQQSTETAPATPASVDVNGSSDTNEDCTEWVTAIGEDTMMFWRGLKNAGLLDEVMEDLQTEIQEILKGLEERIHEPPLQVKDAALLNNIVQNFGMLDLVKKVLASHKSQMDRCREQYTRSLVALEQQCDEHRKHAKELKSKSQHLNNFLMTLTPVTSPPTSKRPRMTRAVSGPATGAATPAQPTHFTLPITQLSGIPLDKVMSAQAQSPQIGGYTVLTSPGGAELQCDGSNLKVLSTAAVSEGTTGPTIVKVVSPFQLVTLPNVGAGATVQNLAAPAGGAAGNTVVMVPVSTVSTASVETVGPQAEQTAERSDDQKEKE
ncbi:glucocorticoid modulatory element-binding protein 2-like [Xyrauchen texanus]|uniref:glucocorticoid modulatory element-binding protein 2-like n=1 Tax=Xyrauchen texanus TaxID=154827 RepID=UPI0022420510|nr:glucocorticoid modulatory element-binding protein 2-like [Xyrauchen texanus]